MGVVVVQSKPVAQVYRLFGALVALLLVMAIGFSIARWRAAQSDGSPYGGLAPVAGAVVPVVAAPARVAAIPATPPSAPTPAAVAATMPAVAAPAVPARPAAGMSPATDSTQATVTTADPVMATAPAPVEPARAQPRVIALEKSPAGAAPLPAPASAVAAATAAQAVSAKPAAAAPAPTAVASATPVPDAAATDGMININTASAEMLDHLPGAGRIGKTIVRHRPYGSVEDLVSHRVLKASDFARIRSHITAN